MTTDEFRALTPAQVHAFHILTETHVRNAEDPEKELDALITSALAPTPLSPYLALPSFHGMFIGIEPDGYTHT